MEVISGYQDVLGPRFYLDARDKSGQVLKGNTLAEDVIPYISRFEYEDHETKFDQLKLQVVNPGLLFSDDARFKEGARYRVRFGYASDMSDIRLAVISRARPQFNMGPTIEMVAFGLQQDMNKTSNPVNYGPVSSSDVAKQVATLYNFSTDIEESGDKRSQARVQPASVTDIQYLLSLAHKLNWDCYVEGTTLHFHHKRMEVPSNVSFTYFTDGMGTLINFMPEVKMTAPPGTSQTGASTRNGTSANSNDPQVQVGVGQNNRGRVNNLPAVDTGTYVVQLPDGSYKTVGKGVNDKTSAELSMASAESNKRCIAIYGQAQAQRIDMSVIKARAEMIGSPKVKARAIIQILGVDQQYCGNWRVVSSHHVIDKSGYKVSVELRKDASKAGLASQNKNNTGNSGTPQVTIGVGKANRGNVQMSP